MKSYDYVCKALELAKKTQDVFVRSVSVCGDPLGKETFTLLDAEGKSHVELIEKLSRELAHGTGWAGTCALDETVGKDMAAELTALVEKYAPPDSCQTELGAVRAAREMVEADFRFYRGWLDQAQDKVEREFIERMRGELRGQVGALANLEAYYEDPEGWAYEQELELSSLDGA